MKIQRFDGQSMKDVLAKAKNELGESAILLHTKQKKAGMWNSLLGRKSVEVWAAVDDNGASRQPDRSAGVEEIATRNNDDPNVLAVCLSLMDDLRLSLRRLEVKVQTLSQANGRLIEACGDDVGQMLICGVEASVAREVSAQANDMLLHEFLPACFRVAQPLNIGDEGKVVALVGPTGMGKTTTIAKLAAEMLLTVPENGVGRAGRESAVALVSVDTYRVGAIEQLKTYARIMDVPLLVAQTPLQAERLVSEAKRKYKMVLIDTIGRSQRDEENVKELATLVEASAPDEVHLVLSVNTKHSDLVEAIDKFSVLPLGSLLFSKLDETTQPGVILSLAWRYEYPISYMTTGQRVPEDIEVADQKRLAEWVLSPVRASGLAENGTIN